MEKNESKRDILLDDDGMEEAKVSVKRNAGPGEIAKAKEIAGEDGTIVVEDLILDMVKEASLPRMSKKDLTEYVLYGESKDIKKKDVQNTIQENKKINNYVSLLREYMDDDDNILRNNPSIPGDYDKPFLDHLRDKWAKPLENKIKKYSGIDDVSKYTSKNYADDIKTAMKLEGPHKDKLIELAIKIIENEFRGYDLDDLIVFDAAIDSDITPEELKAPSQSYEFHSYEHKNNVNLVKHKKMVLDAMAHGAASNLLQSYGREYNDELDSLDHKLDNLYNKIISYTDHLLGTTKPSMLSGKKSGYVKITRPSDGQGKYVIKARGTMFPVLLYEMLKGVMKVLTVEHGLPHEDKDMCDHIMGCTDKNENEPWYMRVGPYMWKEYMERLNKMGISDGKYGAFMEIAKTPVTKKKDDDIDFHGFMKEMLAGHTLGSNHLMKMYRNLK